jgi:hypothetical protein
MKVVNRNERWIGYRLNILGIRVFEDACQLVAKSGEKWVTLGHRCDLPVNVPQNADELKEAAADPLRLTAYQYVSEHRDNELADLLAGRKDFDSAMQDTNAAAA